LRSSPWNFPLAIFLGQVTAALAAGKYRRRENPPNKTPLIAAEAIRLLHESGVPALGAAIRARRRHNRRGADRASRPSPGVVFTGSTEGGAPRSTGHWPRKDGPIVPLIAETGGINAMIADATALPEQVADDRGDLGVFRSAGPALFGRCGCCSCRRTSADRMIEMIAGAGARTQAQRSPAIPATHVGPVIDGGSQGFVWMRTSRGMTSEGAGASGRHRARRQLCRAASVRTVRRGQAHRGSVRTDPPRGALWRRPARPGACRHRAPPATG